MYLVITRTHIASLITFASLTNEMRVKSLSEEYRALILLNNLTNINNQLYCTSQLTVGLAITDYSAFSTKQIKLTFLNNLSSNVNFFKTMNRLYKWGHTMVQIFKY